MQSLHIGDPNNNANLANGQTTQSVALAFEVIPLIVKYITRVKKYLQR